MSTNIAIKKIDSHLSSWPGRVEEIRKLLGAPGNPHLFPPHFLKSVFPKLGGHLFLVEKNGQDMGAAFLFPGNLNGQRLEYNLRWHQIDPHVPVSKDSLLTGIKKRMGACDLRFYAPGESYSFKKTAQEMAGFEFGCPDPEESLKIRHLQKDIWGYHTAADQDFLYPADIHSTNFQPCSSLVVRKDGQVVGFLFGFFKFNHSPFPDLLRQKYLTGFRIESQLLGVTPAFRGKNLGFLLKKAQAELVGDEGIDIINWTFDPLQSRNAVLNFCELGGIAGQFFPEYYPFKNELNQVPASRFGVTWLIRSVRVRKALTGHRRKIPHIASADDYRILNDGYNMANAAAGTPKIAIEIPSNWTRLQREDLAAAAEWRRVTDEIFSRYVGFDKGKYLVTGVGWNKGKYFLIGERVDNNLLERLGL
ncbi:MAG TPA: GNAT family N-acetyltransferase [Bacteroidetes bacterium]|nr:GNAT family N-acetyltransferase [Bacteroidota bacterium]